MAGRGPHSCEELDMKIRTQTLALFGTAALMAAVATGCQTTDPYTGQQQMNRTSKGALIGAGIGVAAGLLTGDSAVERRQHALIGAGVGGLAGGAVGAYQDRQQAALREKLQGTGVDVSRNGDNITLNMPGNITFAFNSANLDSQFYPVLNNVANVMKEYNQTIVEVAGHTDSVGTDAVNQRLSEQRAQAVTNYLVAQGVDSQRFITIGAGKSRPIASNDTEAGRAANRRVEITLVPVRS
jgi:outer membrane protein OmpA-like peptidoglycan-associated protein